MDIPSDEFGSSAETVSGGSKPARIWGSILRICDASSTFCKLLERRALESEAAEKRKELEKSDPRNWPPLLQELEAFEAIKNLQAMPPKEISEAVVRNLIAGRLGIKPQEVPWQQIQLEVAGLLPYTGPRIKLVSSSPAPSEPERQTRESSGSAGESHK